MINHDNLKTDIKNNSFSFEFYKYVVKVFGILEHEAIWLEASVYETIKYYNETDGLSIEENEVINRLKHLTYNDLKKLCKECEKNNIGYEKLELIYFNDIKGFEICILYYIYNKFMYKYFE